jgi:flagellar biosynthesis/type III secretory pathway protein FliH
MGAKKLSYHEYVRSIINRKKYKILKKSLKEGEKNGEKICGDFVGNLYDSINGIHQAKIDLVASTAKTMIEAQLLKFPHTIVSMASNLLKNIADHADVELTLNPVDASTIKASLGEISAIGASTRKLTVLEDTSFMRGSIVIKADKSIIDAHIKTQIEKSKELIGQECKNGISR